MATVTVNNEVLSANTFEHLKKHRKLLGKKSPLMEKAEAKADSVEGGHLFFMDWQTARHSNPTRMNSGYEDIDLNVFQMFTPGWDGWGYVIIPAVISGKTQHENRGPTQKIKLAKERAMDAASNLRELFETHLWQSGVSGLEDFNSLNGADTSTGILEHDAVGSQANTLHNLAKSTVSSLDGFQNEVIDASNSFSGNFLPNFYTRMAQLADLDSLESPDHFWFFSRAFSVNIKRTILAKESYVTETDKHDIAQDYQLYLHGIPGKISSKLSWSATTLSAVLIDFNSFMLRKQSGVWFTPTSWMDYPGKDVQYMCFKSMGQFGAPYLRSHAVVLNADIW